MFQVENDRLKIKVDPLGAELQSLFSKDTGLEYMWSGDPGFWSKHSPVLFPVVGALKDNRYWHDGFYTLPRHGFAREKTFTVYDLRESSIRFLLRSNDETKLAYPFEFDFFITYTLVGNSLLVRYSVNNTGKEQMLFSVGGHPAFAVPLVEGTQYDDYFLQFDKTETTDRWPIAEGGLIRNEPAPFLHNTDIVRLNKGLFYGDAIVLKNLNSTMVSLKSDKTPHGFDFSFNGFPYLGIWAFKDADFVCIEPWQGIADSIDTNQDFSKKEGIVALPVGELFEVEWKIRCF